MPEVRFGGWSGQENRRHRRVPLQVPIECRRGQKTVLAKVENISLSGLLVRCSTPFAQDEEIAVSFTLPDSSVVVASTARVAHAVPGAFVGLEFTGLTPEGRQEIERYVAAAIAAGSSR